MQIVNPIHSRFRKWKVILLLVVTLSFVLIPTVDARTPPNVKAFPTIKKHPEIPSGSEATALTILLNYHGVQITKEEVGQMLPREPLPIVVGERMIGGDPTRAYIGDPFSAEGLGSYQQPMVRALAEFMPGRVIDRTRQPFSQILVEVSQGLPLIVWVTEGLKPAHITHFWWTVDEHLIQWHGNQNTVVLFDFDDSHVFVSDPHTGQIEAYERKNFERIWRDLGSRAIGIDSNSTGTVGTPNTPSPGDQPGNNRPSINYEEERRKLIAEMQRQKDPKLAEKEASEKEAKKTKFGIELWIVIIATFIFLASFITLLIMTLKSSKKEVKEQQPEKGEDEEEDMPRNKGRR